MSLWEKEVKLILEDKDWEAITEKQYWDPTAY